MLAELARLLRMMAVLRTGAGDDQHYRADRLCDTNLFKASLPEPARAGADFETKNDSIPDDGAGGGSTGISDTAIRTARSPMSRPSRAPASTSPARASRCVFRPPACPRLRSRRLAFRPLMGRAFTSDEDRAGSDNVVELSYSLWQNQYHGDPDILGRTIKLDEKPYTVIGVMPPSFHFPFDGKPSPNGGSMAADRLLARGPGSAESRDGVWRRADRTSEARRDARAGAAGRSAHCRQSSSRLIRTAIRRTCG